MTADLTVCFGWLEVFSIRQKQKCKQKQSKNQKLQKSDKKKNVKKYFKIVNLFLDSVTEIIF